MDLRQIENIIAIEQEQSISRAAEKLFLTQSALNQQLLRLEKELGTPLFERRKHSMIPTFAGKLYLTTAHRMVDMKKETYKIIRDISEENAGEISVAYSPERGAMMFSEIYPEFHRKYPNITFRVHEDRVKKMEQLLLQKEVTLACLPYFDDKKHAALEYVETHQELMVLGLPASHPLAHLAGDESWKFFPEIDLSLLQNDPFALISRSTKMRDMIDDCFRQAGFSPKVLMEPSNTSTVVNMVKNQVCAAFFPQSYVDPSLPIVYFTTRPRKSWMQCVAYLKGEYLTAPEKYFIELVGMYGRKKLTNETP